MGQALVLSWKDVIPSLLSMNHLPFFVIAAILASPSTLLRAEGSGDASEISTRVAKLLVLQDAMRSLPFRDIVRAVSGHSVLPVDREDAACREILHVIERAADTVLEALNDPNGPARNAARINEVSAFAEEQLRLRLDAHPEWECGIPVTDSGKRQRSGYPDLRIRHKTSGRVVYLDPKLFAQDQETSAFRTFYYQPRRETNKIQESAHHLLVGFCHDGQSGAWTFSRWKIVDLFHLEVRLKVEFQASNRDLYGSEGEESKE